MADIKGTDWPRLLQELLGEMEDPEVLGKNANDLEAALFFRSQDLENGSVPSSPEEREAMKEAARQLLRVKVHKLGFPINHQLLKFLEEK
jgi:hypothetical protein